MHFSRKAKLSVAKAVRRLRFAGIWPRGFESHSCHQLHDKTGCSQNVNLGLHGRERAGCLAREGSHLCSMEGKGRDAWHGRGAFFYGPSCALPLSWVFNNKLRGPFCLRSVPIGLAAVLAHSR